MIWLSSQLPAILQMGNKNQNELITPEMAKIYIKGDKLETKIILDMENLFSLLFRQYNSWNILSITLGSSMEPQSVNVNQWLEIFIFTFHDMRIFPSQAVGSELRWNQSVFGSRKVDKVVSTCLEVALKSVIGVFFNISD
jgi:hypothetical protein